MSFSSFRTAIFVFLCLFALVSTTVHAEKGVSSTEIVIGMSAPFLGVSGAEGSEMREVIRATFDQVNSGGGIYGRRLALVSFDDDAEPQRTADNTRALIQDHGAFALIGYFGDASVAAALPLINEAKIPTVGAVTGAESLRRQSSPYLFHTRAGYDDEIATMVAQFASLKLTRIAVLYQDGTFGKAIGDSVVGALKKYQLAPAAIASIAPPSGFASEVDVSTAVQAFAKVQPQAVFLLTPYKPAAKLVLQMKKLGLSPQYLALSTVGADQLGQLLGENGRGIGISQVMPYPWDDTLAVVKEYQRQCGAIDRSSTFSYSGIEGYIMARVLVEALKRAGKDVTRAKLINALENMDVDLGGYRISYSTDNHNGSKFVELTVTGRSGRFMR